MRHPWLTSKITGRVWMAFDLGATILILIDWSNLYQLSLKSTELLLRGTCTTELLAKGLVSNMADPRTLPAH